MRVLDFHLSFVYFSILALKMCNNAQQSDHNNNISNILQVLTPVQCQHIVWNKVHCALNKFKDPFYQTRKRLKTQNFTVLKASLQANCSYTRYINVDNYVSSFFFSFSIVSSRYNKTVYGMFGKKIATAQFTTREDKNK